MKLRTLTLAAALGLSGCSMAPKYQQPEAPFAASWQAQAQQNAETPDWQHFFADENLQLLIETALEHNKDLRVAALNVEAFRAQYRIDRSALFPAVDAAGGGNRQRIPKNMSPTEESTINSQYSASLGITAWEIDFFGRLNSLRQQALETYFASEQAQRSAELSLIANVATAWLSHQADQASLALVQSTLETYESSLKLVQSRYDAGVASALELQQARTAADNARVSLAQFQRQVAQSRNALQMVLGAPIPELKQNVELSSVQLAELPVALPAELLQRRPDILQAEHQLKAANANIGAARAAFFPSISLTTTAGSMSNELSDLFSSGSGTWLFQPQLRLPIFNSGRLKASLDYSKVQKDIRIAQYEKSIQTAFQEVADGLIARSTYNEQLAAQDKLLESSQAYLDLAERRYREGVDNQLTLLDAQRLLFSTQQQRINTQLALLTSEINLYKSLGGSYQATSETAE
ncbi:efflux transporter outer membrane subunit [Thiopseudomonas acetoxidans]|uniref:Efflux transporter outer membrane subunit n=1 Tax=Thiopseudomonas acetoxidans TaxID=3041622 RepID=A0ABT7SPN6_9GAMM|nr:efflux transporter outer membrane subunit [Thiopseudomonas sp. CY1220]MDM7858151.1 efflux transporter outer membrane subunit [Thiopseudomonas sp. CY1220]